MTTSWNEAMVRAWPRFLALDRQVLLALRDAPHHAATAGELTQRLGLKSVVQVNAAMGRLGAELCTALGRSPAAPPVQGGRLWQWVAHGQLVKGRGFVWQLREELALSLLSCQNLGLSDGGWTEGRVVEAILSRPERNPRARDACIQAHGSGCVVCGFDFGAAYGPEAQGLIHVHHLVPLHTRSMEHRVDPVHDLRPVCPNCHLVLHQTDPPRSIDAVRTMLQVQRRR